MSDRTIDMETPQNKTGIEPEPRSGSLDAVVGASESRLLNLYNQAHLAGMNVSYCGRKDDDGEFRRAVTVSADVRRFVWRYYTPETECDALEEALNEAVKIYGRTPLRNDHQTNDGRDFSEGESAASARCSNEKLCREAGQKTP